MSDIDRAAADQAAENERREEWTRLAQDEAGQPSPAPSNGQGPTDLLPEDVGQGDAPPGSPAAAKPAGEERPALDELWATAPAPLRETFEAERAARLKAENQVRTQDGRLSAETRRTLQLQSERDALAQRVNASEPEEKAPVVDDTARAQLRDEYPDVAGPLLDVIGGLEQTVRSLAARDASREEQAAANNQLELQRFLAAEEQKLAEQHPDWRDTCATPAFADWAKSQPQFVWDGLQRNGNGIVDATEAAAIVQLYKDANGTGPAARRHAQLNGGRLPVGRIPAATTSTTADREAEWKRLEALEQQGARRASR